MSDFTGDLHTLLTGAAFAPITDRAFLRITGPDATRWLNGMVTNNIQALQPGVGNYNFLLNAQGRIQGDCTVYRTPLNAQTQSSKRDGPSASPTSDPFYLLETDTAQLESIQHLLDKFIIMDDVELTPVMSEHNGLCLIGPGVVPIIDGFDVGAGAEFRMFEFPSVGDTTTILLSHKFGAVPAFELFDRRHFEFPAATQVSPQALEQLRILEARPRYATDIRNTETAKDLPQETNQPHALHFAKGCYVGQEIVERIRSRGQVHRLFTPFRLEGTLPTTFPAPLEANGKPAGELTSATTLPTTEGPIHLALGYARREALEASKLTQATLTYPGGTAHPRNPGTLT